MRIASEVLPLGARNLRSVWEDAEILCAPSGTDSRTLPDSRVCCGRVPLRWLFFRDVDDPLEDAEYLVASSVAEVPIGFSVEFELCGVVAVLLEQEVPLDGHACLPESGEVRIRRFGTFSDVVGGADKSKVTDMVDFERR